MTRPAQALIDLDALRANYQLARGRHGHRAFAVMKANAYGHGAVECARALSGVADGYAVAFLEEALVLRAAGLRHPILILEGVFDAAELRLAQREALWVVVHHEEQLRLIEAEAVRDPATPPLRPWLKVDSGMHRAGFAPQDVASAYARLSQVAGVADIAFMSHFARADEPAQATTAEQIAAFELATTGLPGERSLCNSAGVLAWPAAYRQWARPGIMLYGAAPGLSANLHPALRPVMTLHSRVFAVRHLEPGQALGYGGRFVAQRPTRVGLVALGYADGYPRCAPDGAPVRIDGQPGALIGRVSMDMLTVDLTALPQAGIGSDVQFWGPDLPIDTVADACGAFSYEMLCNVKRVQFQYINR